MAYDEDLANRIRTVIGAGPDLTEQKMRQLSKWVNIGVSYARSLPAKR